MQVIDRYTKDGFTFLLEAFNTPNYLEKISGLAQMIEDTDFDNVSTGSRGLAQMIEDTDFDNVSTGSRDLAQMSSLQGFRV